MALFDLTGPLPGRFTSLITYLAKDLPRNAGRRVYRRVSNWSRAQRLKRPFRVLKQPKAAAAPQGSPATVVCLIRDGAHYLPAFLRHYRSLGIRRFVFIDNGSRDGTRACLLEEDDCILLRSDLPAKAFENDLRRLAAQTYCVGEWCLFADADELFDFEASEEIGMAGLIAYLEASGYTAMLAQMLDLFPSFALREGMHIGFEQEQVLHVHYDLSCLQPLRLPPDGAAPGPEPCPPLLREFAHVLAQNTYAAAGPDLLVGGIRAKTFGEACLLSKHALVRVMPGVTPSVHPHFATGVRCADISGLIRHYKFTNDPIGRDRRQQLEGTFDHGEDQKRLRVAATQKALLLYSPSARTLTSLAPLIREGFLTSSAPYRSHIARMRERILV